MTSAIRLDFTVELIAIDAVSGTIGFCSALVPTVLVVDGSVLFGILIFQYRLCDLNYITM